MFNSLTLKNNYNLLFVKILIFIFFVSFESTAQLNDKISQIAVQGN